MVYAAVVTVGILCKFEHSRDMRRPLARNIFIDIADIIISIAHHQSKVTRCAGGGGGGGGWQRRLADYGTTYILASPTTEKKRKT